MSRYHPIFRALLVACTVLCATEAKAGVISVSGNSYRLDGGPTVTGAWEIAEKIMVARDVAIVVMEAKTKPETVENLLSLLENLKVPTLLTKRSDYKALVKRGVIHPTRTP